MNSNKQFISKLFNICTLLIKIDGFTTEEINSFLRIQKKLLLKLDNEGVKTFVTHVKTIRLCLQRYLTGQPLLVNDGRVRVDKYGLPTILRSFRSHIRGNNHRVIRHLLTLLSVSRGINGDGKVVDLSPITDGQKDVNFEDFISWVDTQDITFEVDSYYTGCEWKKFHFSTKSGPNGLALATSLEDLAIINLLHPQLLEDLKTLSGDDDFKMKVDNMIPLALHLHSKSIETEPDKKKIRKLSVVKDKELKNRVIAIFDYYSQTVLKPVHDTFMKLLSKIPNDRTYNQNPFDLKLYDKYFSLDLKNATDRFPRQLQTKILEKFIGIERAEAWERIMTNHEFSFKGKSYTYGAGQPMGAYSSWSVFAFCHHLIVRYCLSQHPNSNPDCYLLLGDDIVISDSNVANSYILMMSQIGVEISKQKTFESKTSYEFAKRFLHHGIEVSPFPILNLIENQSDPYGIASVIYEARNKGWIFTNSFHGVPDLNVFYKIYEYLGYGKRSRERLVPPAYGSYLLYFLLNNYTFDYRGNELFALDYSARVVVRLLSMESCTKDPLVFLKEHLYPFIQEVKVDKMRKAFIRCQTLDVEATNHFVTLSNTLPSEVTDQVPVYDLQESWPIARVIHDMNVLLTDALAESHMVEIDSPKKIYSIGESIVLPDVNKYSEKRRHNVIRDNISSMHHTVFQRWRRV